MSVRDYADGIPIAGFTGANGAGKTLLAVESAIADMRKGRTVFSTVPIESKHGNSRPIESIAQLLTLSDCTVLLDEVSTIFSSRSTMSLPSEFTTFLQVLRHLRITVRWTAPGWMRADPLLRQVTQAAVTVRPMVRAADGTPWRRTVVAAVGVLDTVSVATDATPDRILRRGVAVLKRSVAFGAYDTHAPTPLLGRFLQGGSCPDCGGTYTRPKHSPERHRELGIPFSSDHPHTPRGVARAAMESPPAGFSATGSTQATVNGTDAAEVVQPLPGRFPHEAEAQERAAAPQARTLAPQPTRVSVSGAAGSPDPTRRSMRQGARVRRSLLDS